jgi:hypothetical protein
MANGIKNLLGRFNIGLTNIEVKHLCASFFGSVGKRNQFAYGRRGHHGPAM